MQKQVTCCGVTFEVFYTATKYRPATHWEPEEGGEIEIEEIFIESVEVGEILSESVVEMIAEKLNSEIEDDQRSEQEDAAERRAEYRREMMEEA